MIDTIADAMPRASGHARLSLRTVRGHGVQASDGQVRDARARAGRDASRGALRRSVRGRSAGACARASRATRSSVSSRYTNSRATLRSRTPIAACRSWSTRWRAGAPRRWAPRSATWSKATIATTASRRCGYVIGSSECAARSCRRGPTFLAARWTMGCAGRRR